MAPQPCSSLSNLRFPRFVRSHCRAIDFIRHCRSIPAMEKIDVVRLRGEQTQAEFAAMLGISVRTLQDWEQGRRSPNGPAVALLRAVQSGTFRKPKR